MRTINPVFERNNRSLGKSITQLREMDLESVSGGSEMFENSCGAVFAGVGGMIGSAATAESGGWGGIAGEAIGSAIGTGVCPVLESGFTRFMSRFPHAAHIAKSILFLMP